jgi:UDP-N-acetylmuramoyl-tripeptide--D-alanyl-D-alanine ligase
MKNYYKILGVNKLSTNQEINDRYTLLKNTNSLNDIIMDAYNANPNSMVEALKNLAKQNHTSKLAIIGDMRELGETGPLEHQKIIDLAQELGLSCWLVGPIFFSLKEKSNFPAFLNTDDAKQYLQNHPIEKALVLLKGSRGIKLEGLSDLL